MNSFFYTFLQRFSLVFLGAASFILLVHAVSPDEFANWALFTVILSTIDIVRSGLLRNALIKFLATTTGDQKQKVAGASLCINLALTAIVILIILFFRHPAGTLLKASLLPDLLIGAIPLLLSLVVFSHYEMLLQSVFRFDIIFRSTFIRPLIQFAGMLALYFFSREHLTVAAALIFQTVGVVVGTLYIYLRGRAEFPLIFAPDPVMIRRMLAFGKYTAGTNLLAQTSRSFDHLLTAYYLPPAISGLYVSYYNVVTRINNMVDVPSLAVADVVYPKNVQAMEEEGITKVKYYFEQVAGSVLAIMLPVSLLLFIFPQEALKIIGGRDYLGASLILRISVIVGMIRPLTFLFGSVMDSIGKPQMNFYINLGLLVISFLLHTFFILQFGGIGAAYALPIQYGITMIVMYITLRKTIGFKGSAVINSFQQTYNRLRKFAKSKS
jgi:lipopolysaccharide exporter